MLEPARTANAFLETKKLDACNVLLLRVVELSDTVEALPWKYEAEKAVTPGRKSIDSGRPETEPVAEAELVR